MTQFHRPPAQSEGQEPRQPPALPPPRPRRGQARGRKAVAERTIADAGKDGAVSIPTDGTSEPQLPSRRASSGERDYVLPGNKDFVAGDRIKKPQGRRRRRRARSGSDSASGEDDFRSR